MPVFKLASNQFDHFYRGGNRIGALRRGPGGPMRPEEWIGSTTTRFGHSVAGLTTLPTGELLRDSIEADPVVWLGEEHVAAFGSSTELLVKLLDLDQRLPVHFHPNKKFASEHLALNHGKTEAWIILEAPVGATVGLGFKEERTKEEILKLVNERDSEGLLASLARFPAQRGDAFLVPAGTPHAIESEVFLLELQEPTDLSALLEWNEFAVDGEKDGHLGLGFDTVLDSLHYSPIQNEEMKNLFTTGLAFGESDASLFSSHADPYFRAHYLTGNHSSIDAGFSIVVIFDGNGLLEFENADPLSVTKGDAIVVSHSIGSWKLIGAKAIVSRPPLPSEARRSQ